MHSCWMFSHFSAVVFCFRNTRLKLGTRNKMNEAIYLLDRRCEHCL